MKKYNQLDLSQKSKALKFIESELRNFMKDPHMTIYFKNSQNDRQIRESVKKIAKNTVYDDNGNVLINESLRA